MDITINSSSFHLPAEIVDLIATQLSGEMESIKHLRLVNELFSRSATPHICDLWASPSELFTLPDGVEEYSESTWPLEQGRRGTQKRGITTWTWIQVPEDLMVEDMSTPEGFELRKLLWAPKTFNPKDSAYERRRTTTRDGRLATCSGRLIESPGTLCILHHWPYAAAWDAYRSSIFAKNLKDFFSRVAPGSIATSKSERMVLPRYHRSNVNCLYDGYHEFRTIHFPPTTSDEQLQVFERKLRPPLEVRPFPDDSHTLPNYVPGANWSWLRGLRNFQGQRTVAMRLVFPWRSTKTKQYHQELITRRNQSGEEDNLFMRWKLVEISSFQLQNTGVVGIESFHSELETGPYH